MFFVYIVCRIEARLLWDVTAAGGRFLTLLLRYLLHLLMRLHFY